MSVHPGVDTGAQLTSLCSQITLPHFNGEVVHCTSRSAVGNISMYVVGNISRYVVGNFSRYVVGSISRYVVGKISSGKY